MTRPNWAAVLVGALTGLASVLLAFLLLGIIGLVDSPSDIALPLLQLLALVITGFVAGRLASTEAVRHGGYAGLVFFAISSAIALAGETGAANLLEIAFNGLVSAVLGSAGGALAGVRSE